MAWFPRSWFGASWFGRWFGGVATPEPLLIVSDAMAVWETAPDAWWSPTDLDEMVRWDDERASETLFVGGGDEAVVLEIVLHSVQAQVTDDDFRVAVELTHG